MAIPQNDDSPRALRRELGVFDATMMGLGAMVGTGIFVSIGIAAGAAGLLAIALAALVAMCNAFSSAQLAASHSVSGGTYEFLAWWVPPRIWLTGCALSLVGVLWHVLARRRWAARAPAEA